MGTPPTVLSFIVAKQPFNGKERRLFMYSLLNNSYQWNMLNENNKINNRIQSLVKSGEQIKFDRMPTALTVMRNRVKSPIFSKMLAAVEEDRMVLLFSKDNSVRVPGFLPFVVMQMGGGEYVAIVFMNLCEARLGENEEILVNERQLKVSMESAYMALCMLDPRNEGKLQSGNLIRPASKIYAYMIAECINRRHSIKMDQNVFNAVCYILTKFFVRTTMGVTSNEDVVENYCMGNCQKPDTTMIHNIADQLDEKAYTNIATLLGAMVDLPALTPRLGKLTVSNFTESFINMYDIANILSLENFPYFVFNVISVVDTTYVNNYYHLKNIVGDDGRKIYAMLVSSIC